MHKTARRRNMIDFGKQVSVEYANYQTSSSVGYVCTTVEHRLNGLEVNDSSSTEGHLVNAYLDPLPSHGSSGLRTQPRTVRPTLKPSVANTTTYRAADIETIEVAAKNDCCQPRPHNGGSTVSGVYPTRDPPDTNTGLFMK